MKTESEKRAKANHLATMRSLKQERAQHRAEYQRLKAEAMRIHVEEEKRRRAEGLSPFGEGE